MTKNLGMNEYLKLLASGIRKGSGNNFLVFLDTSAILDFEDYSRTWRVEDRSHKPAAFYESLMRAGFPVYINKQVLKEVRKHHEKNRIGNSREVSAETMEFAQKMYSDYHEFLQVLVAGNPKEIEDIRYDVYWASKLAFSDDHKKVNGDRISLVDRSLVTAAVWSRYVVLDDNAGLTNPLFDTPNQSKSIDHVVVVSADSHISETLRVLTDHTIWPDHQDPLYTYDSIRAVDCRMGG